MAGRDDDALSWGDDDPTLDTGASERRVPSRSRDVREAGETEDAPAPPLPTGFTPVGKGSETLVADEKPSLSNAGLLALGVLGGVYVLFAIGWLVGGLRLQPVAGFLVASDGNAPPLWTGGNVVALCLAVAAPLIWFGVVYWLTAHTRPWLRWMLLALGVVLLVPWPFVMVGAVGA